MEHAATVRRDPSSVPLWRSVDVCRVVGVSYRSLDHWCRLWLHDTPGQGVPRNFTATEVRWFALMHEFQRQQMFPFSLFRVGPQVLTVLRLFPTVPFVVIEPGGSYPAQTEDEAVSLALAPRTVAVIARVPEVPPCP